MLLLGIIALVPAIITASLDTQRLRSLSAALTARNADALAEQALITMQRIAAEYADVLDRESRRIRVLTTLQADYAEQLLREADGGARPAGEVFFSDDFDRDAAALSLTTPPVTASGDAPIAVSWTHQVFQHGPNTAVADLLLSARALLPMMRFYNKVRDPDDRIVHRQYVVLENGLSASYPGHGAYPPGFDARERPWYQAQKDAPGFRWFRPHFDASSRTLVINATMPLLDKTGNFVGISGIDVDLSATFEVLQLPPYLREGSELMQVAALSPPFSASRRVVVLARQNAAKEYLDWQTLPELESFSLGSRATNTRLQDAMYAHENGHLKATVNGRECFVLYRRFGETASYLVMIVPLERATFAALEGSRYADTVTNDHVATLLKFLLAASTLVVVVALVSSRHLTRPIEHLKIAVERLANGDFEARAVLTTGDELQTLGDAFDNMVPQLKEHARVGESLNLAREIQQQLLPEVAPKLSGYDLAGVSLYSDQTGGDYFDYVPLESASGSRYGVVVADVSGHGIGPSLLMATTRALLHGGRGRGLSLGELLDYVNRQLAADVSRGHFVTLFLLAVESEHGRIEWATAGHDPALHFNGQTGTVSQLGGEDIPLGIDSDWRFSSSSGVELAGGDIVVIGTDGIWETLAENGERFGKQRICDYISAHADATAQALCAGLKAQLEQFRGSALQNDDITIVVVKRPHLN